MLVVVDFTLGREVYLQDVEPGGFILCAVGATKEEVEAFLGGVGVEEEYYFDGVYDLSKLPVVNIAVNLGEYYLLKSEDVVLLSEELYEGYRLISVGEFLRLLRDENKYEFEVSLENTILRSKAEAKKSVASLVAVAVGVLLLFFVVRGFISLQRGAYERELGNLQSMKTELEAQKKRLRDRYYVYISRQDLTLLEKAFSVALSMPFLPDSYELSAEKGKQLQVSGRTYAEVLGDVLKRCRESGFNCSFRYSGGQGGLMQYEVIAVSR